MRVLSFVIVSIMCVGIMACTTLETNEPVYQAEETRSAQSATASSTPLPVVTVLPSTIQPSPTTTVDNSVIQTPVAISATVVPDVSFDLVQIATIEPVLSIHSSLPETVWWSEDSQTVYYQDV